MHGHAMHGCSAERAAQHSGTLPGPCGWAHLLCCRAPPLPSSSCLMYLRYCHAMRSSCSLSAPLPPFASLPSLSSSAYTTVCQVAVCTAIAWKGRLKPAVRGVTLYRRPHSMSGGAGGWRTDTSRAIYPWYDSMHCIPVRKSLPQVGMPRALQQGASRSARAHAAWVVGYHHIPGAWRKHKPCMTVSSV